MKNLSAQSPAKLLPSRVDARVERIRRSPALSAIARATTILFSSALGTILVVDASLASGCGRESSREPDYPRPIADGGRDDDLIALPGSKSSIRLVRRGALRIGSPDRERPAYMTRDQELDAGRP
jgi:hypothetical protein